SERAPVRRQTVPGVFASRRYAVRARLQTAAHPRTLVASPVAPHDLKRATTLTPALPASTPRLSVLRPRRDATTRFLPALRQNPNGAPRRLREFAFLFSRAVRKFLAFGAIAVLRTRAHHPRLAFHSFSVRR